MATLDQRGTLSRPGSVSDALRVGLDLDGSLESLSDSMNDLADALDALRACELVRFRTLSARRAPDEARLAGRAVWAPLWRRGVGPAIDRFLEPLDVIHVAGRATPPTKSTPLVISVDDLRPLRGESREHQRINQLRRAADHGATLVASTRSASHEVQRVLHVARTRVAVVPPAVPLVETTSNGTRLVVNLTGDVEPFFTLWRDLIDFAQRHDTQVEAVTSAKVAQRIRSRGIDVHLRARSEARLALSDARVVLHISDGARFPSFAIAALAAGVPTIARATAVNRELLSGAAALTDSDSEVPALLEDLWDNSSRRAIAIAAGRARAQDFAPATAARAYMALYREAVRG